MQIDPAHKQLYIGTLLTAIRLWPPNHPPGSFVELPLDSFQLLLMLPLVSSESQARLALCNGFMLLNSGAIFSLG